AVTQMSNVLGTVVPVAEIVKKAHAVGAKVLVDGSQAVVHFDIDVQPSGCEMIDQVSFEKITFKEAPFRFEAGTPAIVEAIGLGAAIDYLNGIDRAACHAQEQKMLAQAE